MFDTLGEKIFCPYCGEQQKKDLLQGKDIGDTLSSWTFKEILTCCDYDSIYEFSGECADCGKYISLNFIIRRMKPTLFKSKEKQE